MSFKVRTFLISFIICGIFMSLMLLLYSSSGHFMAKLFPDGGMRILMCFVFGFLIGFIVSLFVFLFSKNVKQQNEIMDELEKNGYSDRFIQLLRAEVSRLSYTKLTQISLNYIIMLADAYLLRGNPQEAANIINLVNPKKNPIFSPTTPMGTSNQIKFYNVQMGICEPLGQVDRANNIMREAMPILNSNMGKSMQNDMFIWETFSVYNILIGRYDEAMRYADSFFKYNNRAAKILGNIMKTRVCYYLRDGSSAYQYYTEAEKLVEKPVERDMMNYVNKYYLQSPVYN